MAGRKPRQKPKEKGISIKQYKRKAIRNMGVAAMAAVLAGFSVKHYHVEMKRINAQQQEWIAKENADKKRTAEFNKNLKAKSHAEIVAAKKQIYRQREIAKLEPKTNITSVLYTKIPVQNRLSAGTVKSELSRFSSPMTSTNVIKVVREYSIKKGIDPAYILSVSRMETRHGTDTTRSRKNKNPGNLKARNKKVKQDEKGFMVFSSWEAGTRAMIDRLASKTYVGGGHTTVKDIANIYAPPSENATNSYIHNITSVRNHLYKLQKKDNVANQNRL